jgi:iron(III) transport system ATP-binding protein
MGQVVLKNVTKAFVTKAFGSVTAVDKINLNIKEGECFSFLGPSGCGKTTTLRLIAGFEDLTNGEIWIGNKPMSIRNKNYYLPPENRGLGMVFQAFAVWPHLNVFENVAFPLRILIIWLRQKISFRIIGRTATAYSSCQSHYYPPKSVAS